jgi:membrane fusion protein (multidrug efflux system)
MPKRRRFASISLVSWLKTNRTSAIVVGLAFLISVGAYLGLLTSDGAVKARERASRLEAARTGFVAEETASFEVDFIVARKASSTEILELTGVLEPIRSTWVAAEIAGRIVEVPAVEYSTIAANGLLVRLDSALPEAELIRAKASHQLARDELDRQQRLGSQSVASEADLDRANAEERRSYAALLEARTRLDHTRIRAPFDGLINSLQLDPGAYVQPGAAIAQILDVSSVEITVLVGDLQIGALEQNAPVGVRVDPLGNERFEGRIARVGGAPEENSQRYPVVVVLENDAGQFRPGMLATLELEVGNAIAIRLPVQTIQHEFELDYVFVLDDEDRARRIRVVTRPVPFRPDQIEIRSGLQEGDRIVVSSVSRIRDGMRVIAR